MHLSRMQNRAPSARPVAIGYLLESKIEFRKRSVDGSAKADAKPTGNPSDQLWGVVYEISRSDKISLDEHEFLGIGYDEKLVEIMTNSNGSCDAWIYLARTEAIDHAILPYSWYVDYIQQGAMQHRIPLCYIINELNVPTITDPDSTRRNRNQQICSTPRQPE